MATELPPVSTLRIPPDLSQHLKGATAFTSAAGDFKVARVELSEGPSRGVELLVVETDRVRAALCPTRGLGLWQASIDGKFCGWKSPVEGPVHPALVPIAEESGLGWLEGFDELVVRCGMRSFGAPEFGEDGKLAYGLHGRVANLPARGLTLNVDHEHSLLEVSAEVHESRFLQWNLRLEAKYVFAMGQATIEIRDTLKNASSTPATAQMLYHINVGPPFLGQGSKLHLTTDRVVARNEHASVDRGDWATYLAPTIGYEEQVYFSSAKADSDGWAKALLTSPKADVGFSVAYKTDNLPFFTQWKNTVGESDGYVTGLEPGTGFPNPRSFEQQHGRVLNLEGGQSVDFQLRLSTVEEPDIARLVSEAASDAVEAADFDPEWCTPR